MEIIENPSHLVAALCCFPSQVGMEFLGGKSRSFTSRPCTLSCEDVIPVRSVSANTVVATGVKQDFAT